MLNDSKYLVAYVVPLITVCCTHSSCCLCYATLVVIFVLITVLEALFPLSADYLDAAKAEAYRENQFFDWMLYFKSSNYLPNY